VHSELSDLAIAHVDCDAFYASVEKRDRPELEHLPVIVGHPGGRGVVTTACYVARISGVRSAMPMFQARTLCPEAIVVSPDMAKYKAVSAHVRSIFHAETTLIEPLSLDEAYLDLSPPHRTSSGTAAEALVRIARRVDQEVGITVSIGLSCNKFLAKLASEMEKPRGFSVIGRREAKSVLAPLSVQKINGVGAVTARRLQASGIATIGDLQTRSEAELVARFGRFGRRLAQFAQGDDDRQVTADRPTKSISAETTLERDTKSAGQLSDHARALCERVAAQLSRKELAGGTLVLKLKTSEFRLVTRHQRLEQPTRRAAVLFEAASRLIAREADGRSFRLIGIGVESLCPASVGDAPGLFDLL
jgi:DNA polymerase-4